MRFLNFFILQRIFAQEIFSSKKALEELDKYESDLIDSLLLQIKNKLEQFETLETRIEDVKTQKRKSSIDHPIEQFKIINRFLTFWTVLESEMEDLISFPESSAAPPNREDLIGAAEGLFRIQDVYSLDSTNLADGMALGIKNKEPSSLTVEETLSVGKIAYWQSDHYHSSLWLVAAWKQNLIENDESLAVQILDHLSISVAELGDVQQALEITVVLMQMRPEEARYGRNYKYYLGELGLDEDSTLSSGRGMNFSADHLLR